MPTNLKSFLTRIAPFGAGLVTAQALATWHVWQSNQLILKQSQTITAAGWLSIPCGPAVAGLATLKAAFWGGLFFTLSLGAGLSLLAWGMLSIFGQDAWWNRFNRVILSLVWAIILFVVNSNGILIWGTAFVLLVPLAFGAVYLKSRAAPATDQPRYLRFVAPGLLVLLSVLWFTQYNDNLFINIRDRLLLSNSVGRSVNTFYYRYTLYPAEAFKSFDQKTVRTCALADVRDPQLTRRLADRLIALNVLPLDPFKPVDLEIRENRGQLILHARDSAVLSVSAQVFEADPGLWLTRFSVQSDPYGGLRSLIFASLLLAFPLLIFVLLYGLLKMAAGFLFKPVTAIWVVAGTGFAFGLLLLAPIISINKQNQPNPIEGLNSPKRTDRLLALRVCEGQKLDISAWPRYKELLRSTEVPERYWLARALANSPGPLSFEDLLRLLNDPEPIVRCQALYALGQRGDTRAIEPVLAHITSSDHWYVQWYAYGALRRLGWRQKPLI